MAISFAGAYTVPRTIPYANAELTKAEQAREVIAFADYWQNIGDSCSSGGDSGVLVLI